MEEKKPKILVVDDNDKLLESTMEYLQEFDFEVVVARDYQEGLDRSTDSGPFFGIISDFNLPGGNGVSLVAEIRTRLMDNEIRIIMVSGRINDLNSEITRQGLQVLKALAKPYSLVEIVKLLQAA
jgi:two-component system, cell cycle sensor histidine kinase and response regulator CckA